MRLPLSHLLFKRKLCEVLLLGWSHRDEIGSDMMLYRPACHMPSTAQDRIWRLWIVCKKARPTHIVGNGEGSSCAMHMALVISNIMKHLVDGRGHALSI